jgi:acyl-CoA reductase-like NAD-dependent aldehyde dehydrogenase
MNIHAQANGAGQKPYAEFDRFPIGSEWRRGKMHPLKNYDPYTNEVIVEIPQADRDDAFAAATRAQETWARELPSAWRDFAARDVQGPWS